MAFSAFAMSRRRMTVSGCTIMANRTPQAIRSARSAAALAALLGRARLLPQPARPEPQAVQHRHPAAERDRRPAHGPRPQQHAARRADPLAAHAGLQRPVDARHRSRRHRHAGRGGTAHPRGGEARPATTSAARSWSAASGSGRTSTRSASSASSSELGCSCDWQRTRFTLDPICARAVRHDVLQHVPRRPDLPRQTPGELGHAAANRRWPTTRPITKTIKGGFWTFRYPVKEHRASSSASRRPGPRRCSAIPPWPCIPTTSATST